MEDFMDDEKKQSAESNDEHLDIEKLLSPEEFNKLIKNEPIAQQKNYSSNIIKSKDAQREYPTFEDYAREDNESTTPAEEENVSDKSSQEYLIRNFKDFLVLPRIAGAQPSGTSRIIHNQSSEGKQNANESDSTPQFQELLTGETSVIINRNTAGEIESIEVYCKDGEKVLIRFDFDDNSNTTNELQ